MSGRRARWSGIDPLRPSPALTTTISPAHKRSYAPLQWPARATLAVLLILPTAAHAQDAHVQAAEIYEYGTYDIIDGGRVPHEGLANGYLASVLAETLKEQTDVVCGRVGVTFGVRYRILGEPRGTTVVLDMVTRFPTQGMINKEGKTFYKNAYKAPVGLDYGYFRSFTFDEPWEVVFGIWTLEFYFDGRKVAERAFTVRNCDDISSRETSTGVANGVPSGARG
jgi:hypothetical protein